MNVKIIAFTPEMKFEKSIDYVDLREDSQSNLDMEYLIRLLNNEYPLIVIAKGKVILKTKEIIDKITERSSEQ